jgi:hypothetical protein
MASWRFVAFCNRCIITSKYRLFVPKTSKSPLWVDIIDLLARISVEPVGEMGEPNQVNVAATSGLEGAREARAPGCRHQLRARPYRFQGDLDDPLCVMCAILYRPVLRRAVYIALVVGTILTAINQGDVLLAGEITPLVIAKIFLTYLVPYSVSTFSALSANRVVETALKRSNRA